MVLYFDGQKGDGHGFSRRKRGGNNCLIEGSRGFANNIILWAEMCNKDFTRIGY